MKTASGKRSLEGLRIFPYVAWLLIGSFAWFTYMLNAQVTTLTDQLEQAQREKNTFPADNSSVSDSYEPTASAR